MRNLSVNKALRASSVFPKSRNENDDELTSITRKYGVAIIVLRNMATKEIYASMSEHRCREA